MVLFLILPSHYLYGRENPAAVAQNNNVTARLPKVHLDGEYFVRDGKRFLPVGAHWVPAKAAMQWPVQWDPKDIEADFVKMHELGYTMVRFDLMWAWFEPRPGDYNPEAFKQLDYLISLAHKYEIYLHPSLFIGGEVGEAYWDVPWRHGRNPQADPEMLRLETNHAAEFGRRYANESAIMGWDLTDEPPFWIVASQTTDAMAINWTRLITGALRRYDTLHPIVAGTSQEDLDHGPFRPDNIAGEVDFFSVHPFTIYNANLYPDPMVSQRGTYGAAFQIALSSGAGRPAMIHEMGGSSAQYSPERIATYDRLMMYSGLGTGSIGFDLWCYTDAAPEQFRKAPYLRTPQETRWGMTTWDRQDRPLATEFKKFLVTIDTTVPEDLDIHVVCDNYGTHKTPAIKGWLAKHPRVHMHFTPTGSSWLNQVERWFGFLTDQKIRRGAHKSVQALEADIRSWIKSWNDNPKPFVWKKSAEEILDSLARYLQRISGAGH